MQENNTKFQIYRQLIFEFIPKILKLIPKNKKDLKSDIEKQLGIEKINNNNIQYSKTIKESDFINANIQINMFRELLDLKITKLSELTLTYLEKLIVNDLIDGHDKYSTTKTIIDEILQMVVECVGIKDDYIHLLVVRNLHTIFMTPSCTVFGENLVFIVQALTNIYSQNGNSKSINLQNVCQLALKNIVKKVYERMEKYTEINSEHQDIFCLKRCITSNRVGELLFQENSFSSCNLANESKQTQNSPANSSLNLNNDRNSTSPQILNKQQQDIMEGDQIDPSSLLNVNPNLQEHALNFSETDIKSQIEDYCSQAVTNLVDHTCIYFEKQKTANQEDQKIIPRQCVPPFNKEQSIEYNKFTPVKIINEFNNISGKFGWCFVCRKGADYYCKHTRVAVCSPECKMAHIKAIDDIQYLQQNKKRSVSKNQYLEDGIELFKYLCQLSKRDGGKLNSQINPQNLKAKIISLDTLKQIIENTGMVFLSNFSSLVKELLIHSVLENSMSSDQRVVQLSLQILVHLIIDFRENLKKEIEMFVKDILLKMLDSSNTIYNHRFLVLQVFNSIFKTPRIILEMFANYDCQINSKNIAQSIVELLARIAQGKYSKAEFASLIQQNQEQILRETALISLVEVVKQLIPFTVLSEEYFELNGNQGTKQAIQENGTTAQSSERQLDSKETGINRSSSNLEEIEESKSQSGINNEENWITFSQNNHTQDQAGKESLQSPQRFGSAQNLSQFNSVGGGVSDSSFCQENVNNEDNIQEQRKRKMIIQKCLAKFNYKAKVGLQLAFEEKIIEKPKDLNKKPSENENESDDLSLWQRSVYQFGELLYNQRGSIDRTQLGIFLSQEDIYNTEVFQQFISFFDMSKQNIVQGLRTLFKIIYPPGTSEALDRILQQFGEKYIKDNPNCYKNASVTYTLSYAIMMLQTNLYNPQIKEKDIMTLASFTRLVSKINDGEDLPAEHVESIFNNVKEEPLGIHDEEEYQKKIKEAINSDAVIKIKKFKEEQEKMLEKGKKLIQSEVDEESHKYIRVLNSNFTRELLDVIWSPLFATFSQGLEQSDDKKFILACLEGFKYCVMLLGRYQLYFQQETFVQCLVKNTSLLLDKSFSIKNILSSSCLVEIASTSGNWLRGSWKSVLDCLSRIDYYLSGDFVNKDFSNLSQNLIQIQQETDRSNQKLLQISLENEVIDKIFSSTSKFDCDAIQDFIDCLCQTCQNEINLPKPRTFSLQRISEVAEFNMDRVRFEWNKIWQTLSFLFQEVGTKSNPQCCALVIDLLKQLSLKFLKKTELSHYSFQRTFLQPFLYIFEQTDLKRYEIFELILSCIKMITSIHFDNLRSGWSVIISLVTLTINKKVDSLIVICSQIIDQIFLNDRTLENLIEVIPEIGEILCKLIKYKDQNISSNSINYLNKLIDYLVVHSKFTQNIYTQSQIDSKNDLKIQIEMKQNKAKECEKMLSQLWIPSLSCLSQMFDDERIEIQRKRITCLFQLVETYSHLFTEDFWNILFIDIFIPYFEQMSTYLSEKMNSDQSVVLYVKFSCQISFDSLKDIFILNFPRMQSCLKYVIKILKDTITAFKDIISKIAAEQMQSLLRGIGQYLSSQQLDEILSFLETIFETSLPMELAENFNKNEYLIMKFEDVIVHKKITNINQVQIQLDLNYKRILSQVIIQLICINCCKDFFVQYSNKFSIDIYLVCHILINLNIYNQKQLERLKKQLFNSYQFATEFNSMIVFRYTLLKNGFLSDATFPHLLLQQRDSRSVLLLIWFENYVREVEENKVNETQSKAYLKFFLDNAITTIQKFVEYSKSVSDSQENQNRLQFDTYYNRQNDDNIQNFEKIIKNQYLLEKNKYILYLRNNIAQIILPNLKLISPIEYYDNLNGVLNQLIELSSYSFSRNLLSITCTSCQKCDMCKSQSVDSFDLDLKIIIQNIIKFMSQFMPATYPQEQIKKNDKIQKEEELKDNHQIQQNGRNQNIRETTENVNQKQLESPKIVIIKPTEQPEEQDKSIQDQIQQIQSTQEQVEQQIENHEENNQLSKQSSSSSSEEQIDIKEDESQINKEIDDEGQDLTLANQEEEQQQQDEEEIVQSQQDN